MSQPSPSTRWTPAVVGMPLEDDPERDTSPASASGSPTGTPSPMPAIDGWRRAQHRFIGNTQRQARREFHSRRQLHPLASWPCRRARATRRTRTRSRKCSSCCKGHLTVFIEDEAGTPHRDGAGAVGLRRPARRASSTAINNTVEMVYLKVMVGRGKPETMGYAEEKLYRARNDHLETR